MFKMKFAGLKSNMKKVGNNKIRQTAQRKEHGVGNQNTRALILAPTQTTMCPQASLLLSLNRLPLSVRGGVATQIARIPNGLTC